MKCLRYLLPLGVVLFTGCQSGDISHRRDYSDSSFAANDPETAMRAQFLQNQDPDLTEDQAFSLASAELAVKRGQQKRDAEKQDEFEESLAEFWKSQE